jgi:probable F420-dependent oxidoreductase
VQMTLRAGVTLSPSVGFDPGRVLALGRLAERLGYASVWFPESNQADAIGVMHACAVQTKSVRLGTAVIPIQTRTPALVAMGFSVLSYLAPGRLVLGVGHSSPNVAGRWHGRDFVPTDAIAQVREFVEAFRQCISGAKTDFEGRWYRSHGFRLRLPPNPSGLPVPVYVGALGDRSILEAAEYADGVLVSFVLPERVGRLARRLAGRRELHSSERSDGPCSAPFSFVVTLNVAVGEGEPLDRAASEFRRQIVNYAIVDAYAKTFALAGYEPVVKAIREAWESGDRKAALEAVPEEMCRELGFFGTPEGAVDRMAAYLDAGAGEVAISIVEGPGLVEAEAALDGLAQAMARREIFRAT